MIVLARRKRVLFYDDILNGKSKDFAYETVLEGTIDKQYRWIQ